MENLFSQRRDIYLIDGISHGIYPRHGICPIIDIHPIHCIYSTDDKYSIHGILHGVYLKNGILHGIKPNMPYTLQTWIYKVYDMLGHTWIQ